MDGAAGGSKIMGDPEGLLRSALEKIVFFECRVSQLESELDAARGTAERARGDAARSELRAVELEQALAGERSARAAAERRATEQDDRVRLLEAERERLLDGLVDRARVSGAPADSGAPGPEEGGADLAGFIAELRAEIDVLRTFRAQAEAAGFRAATVAGGAGDRSGPERRDAPPVPEACVTGASSLSPRPAGERARVRGPSHPSSLSSLASRFETSGRVGFTARDSERMKDLLATRADRALYERSMDDLSSPDAGRRARAVRALEALGSRAAAPLLASALGREEDGDVKVALLAALARFKEPFAAGLAERELEDRRPAVRVAALEVLAAVAVDGAGPVLARALSDESPLVRRRAVLLLGFQAGDAAEEALAVALCDADKGVARAAAAALSGRPSARAQEALARGLEHPDESVRRAAGLALSRISGEPVDADASPSARRATTRRIAERLATMGGEEIRAAVLRSAANAKVTAERVIAATATVGATSKRTATATPSAPAARTAAPTSTPTATATSTATSTAKTTSTSTSTSNSISPSISPSTSARADLSPLPRASGGEGQGEGASAPRAAAARTAVAVLAAPAAAPAPDLDLEPRVVAEIRAALRGCTAEGLAAALGAPAPGVEAALRSLAAKGTVAQRGTRWFMS